MALGIGASAAIFSGEHGSLPPTAVREPDRLVKFGTLPILELEAYREPSRNNA